MLKYKHKEETHNLKSPAVIAPILMKLVNPKSVIDIGCGVGTFLYSFKKLGVKEVLGLDGHWADKELLKKYLEPTEFRVADLNEIISFDQRFDLAVCLEVAEHIDKEYSDNLVKTLVNASNIILFSAAVPGQRGQHHVNEQWPDYWIKKFLQYDYHFHDLLRPALWNNPEVDFWYKQNSFIVVQKNQFLEEELTNELTKKTFNNVIHPDAFAKRSNLYLNIIDGEMNTGFYLRLLLKNILKRVGIHKKPRHSDTGT